MRCFCGRFILVFYFHFYVLTKKRKLKPRLQTVKQERKSNTNALDSSWLLLNHHHYILFDHYFVLFLCYYYCFVNNCNVCICVCAFVLTSPDLSCLLSQRLNALNVQNGIQKAALLFTAIILLRRDEDKEREKEKIKKT